MEAPPSTIENSTQWKLWHSINYSIGGIGFLIGSAFLFPHLNHYFPAAVWSAWLYTIGSLTFVFADLTQFLHYVYKDCRYLGFAVNFFLSQIGSFIYLVGSASFLPQINQSTFGLYCFIVGSSFVMFSQTLKLVRGFYYSDMSFMDTFKADPSGVFVDFLAGIGGIGYFVGSFFFLQAPIHPQQAYPGASFFTYGGTMFFISGIFMQKRYFFDFKEQNNTLMPEEKNTPAAF